MIKKPSVFNLPKNDTTLVLAEIVNGSINIKQVATMPQCQRIKNIDIFVYSFSTPFKNEKFGTRIPFPG